MASGVSSKRAPVYSEFAMAGEFACLEGNVHGLVRNAIAGVKGFTIKDCGHWIAFDYKADHGGIAQMFPDPHSARNGSRDRWMLAVRRECRGMLVCPHTGQVLRRALHKFFNLDELPETTNIADLQLPPEASCSEKLDGSLVSPLLVGNELVWVGKSVINPAVAQYMISRPQFGYESLARECMDGGRTALYEWCPVNHVAGCAMPFDMCSDLW